MLHQIEEFDFFKFSQYSINIQRMMLRKKETNSYRDEKGRSGFFNERADSDFPHKDGRIINISRMTETRTSLKKQKAIHKPINRKQ